MFTQSKYILCKYIFGIYIQINTINYIYWMPLQLADFLKF